MGCRLTGGDVADAYWRSGRQDELVEIVRYAIRAGLVPMLMTHGQTLIEHPEFLEKLMTEGGLRQVAVHIDMTQAGRHGYPIGRIKSEADLHPVRDAFTTARVWTCARKPACRWSSRIIAPSPDATSSSCPRSCAGRLEKPERTHLWRMFSFQPEADTGRTLFFQNIPPPPPPTWAKTCARAPACRWNGTSPSSAIPIATRGRRCSFPGARAGTSFFRRRTPAPEGSLRGAPRQLRVAFPSSPTTCARPRSGSWASCASIRCSSRRLARARRGVAGAYWKDSRGIRRCPARGSGAHGRLRHP